jgi:hypothetical protein
MKHELNLGSRHDSIEWNTFFRKPVISPTDDEPIYLRESNPFGPTSILSLYLGPARKLHRNAKLVSHSANRESVVTISTAWKAPETIRRWTNRPKIVFDFLGLNWSLNERAKQSINLCVSEKMALVQDKVMDSLVCL